MTIVPLEANNMKKLLLITLLACPVLSQACSFAPGYHAFIPAPAAFTARMEGDRAALLPAPRVTAIRLTRGTAEESGMCGGFGQLSLELDWPASSAYRLGEVGFYFRVLGADRPDHIFPLKPITGKLAGQARFHFIWPDGPPSNQQPLNFEVEVFAVNKGLEIGPASRFRVTDDRRVQ